ncbi:hypothetical protein BD310DRAFT_821614, partial [Dichomitus squalens]
ILVTLASRFSLILADLVGLYITWYRTHETIRIAHRNRMSGGHNKPTFSFTLLRDGTIYFSTLLILNGLNVAFTMSSVSTPSQYHRTCLKSSQVAGNDALEPSNLISVFEEPLTAILTSRFLINLQKVKRRLEDSSRSLSKVSEIAFQPYHSGSADGPIESSRIQQLSHEDDTEYGTGDDGEELP